MQRDSCKACTVVARNLNLHKDLVQGVHRSEVQLKVEEAGKKSENQRRRMPRREGGIYLREILRSLSDRNPRDARSAQEIKVLTDQAQEE
jgi:hypothetical protein